jgi:O-antigen/teichoic acid export membrane protein
VTRNGLITLAAMVATVSLTYLFQAVMARQLSTREYGELSVIVATLNVVTIPIFGLSTAITRDVAARRAGHSEPVGNFLRLYSVRVGSVTVAVIAGVLFSSPWLVSFLQLSSPIPLVYLALLVTLTNALGVGRSAMLGLHLFGSLAVNQVAEALIRLVSGTALAAAGLVGAAGFAGYSIGQTAALLLMVHLAPWLRRPRLMATTVGQPCDLAITAEEATLHNRDRDISWAATIVAGTSIVLLNFDLIVVKHFLPPEQAGQYAAISVLAKALFVVTNAFDLVLFPSAAAARARGVDESAHLRRALWSIGAIVIPILGVYWLGAAPLVSLLFGPRYLGVASLLATYALAVSLLGIATLFARYRLAIGRAIPTARLLALVGLAGGAFLVFHETLEQIVGVLLLIGVAALAVGVLGLGRSPSSAGENAISRP